jgi:CHAD domain-containing protein
LSNTLSLHDALPIYLMEVEAKFSLPDPESLHRFQAVTQLAGFPLGKGRMVEIHDTYVDTLDRKILAAGFACRFRQEAEGVRITLKGIGGASGAIHKRQEMELLLQAIQSVEEWPTGPLRVQVLQITGGDLLLPLFELHQTRLVRPVRWHGQTIAGLSLDDVHGTAGGREQAYYELEVELTSQGSEEQLTRVADCLQQKYQLRPEPLSKFERALALLDFKSEHKLLKAHDHAILIRVAERQDWYGLRSRALLALDKGLSNEEVGRQLKRSKRTIRRWLAGFRKLGLGIFPASVLEETPPPAIKPRGEVAAAEPPQVLPPVPTPPGPRIKLPRKVGLKADDLMTEGLRKIMHFEFQHMLYHEAGTQLGQDIEELHDMRVATRRMRAALQVFGDYLDEKTWAPFDKGLRRTGRILGEVRDLDVFWEKTQRYLDSLPPERRDELAPLQAVWMTARDQARARLLSYLDSKRYRKFKESFNEFLKIRSVDSLVILDAAGIPKPRRLRHVAPVILYQRLAAMSAFEEWMTGPNIPLARLHQLRIASKGLRYALEFLQEVLGAEAAALIKEMKILQDHLGDLQDAVVASNLLRDFLTWGTWGHEQTQKALPLPIAPVVAPGVATYLAARQAELQDLPASLPEVWARIQSSEFKHNFIAALEVL